MEPTVILRYFDCRGRAQAFRYWLAEREIDFRDERVRFDDQWRAWTKLKQDPSKSGPFGRLPILHWGDKTIAETRVISSFLHEQLDAKVFDPQQNLMIQMLESSILEDIGRVYIPLNLDLSYRGADVHEVASRTITEIIGNLLKYQDILMKSTRPYLVAHIPTIADYWLYEALRSCEIVFEPVRQSLFEEVPELCRFLKVMQTRPGIQAAEEKQPQFLTARPDFQQRLSELHEVLADFDKIHRS